MLTKEGFIVIQALIRQGVYLCDIARQLGVHPKTVRRALLRGRAPDGRRGRRRSQLDPYRADIDRLLTAGVWNAVVIFRELQAKGYAGQLSILRDYIRPKRTLRPSRATVRFETEPGHQMQSDWAVIQSEIAGRPTTVAFIVNTLGFSRRIHFWCSHSTDAEHTYEGLIGPSNGSAASRTKCWSIIRRRRCWSTHVAAWCSSIHDSSIWPATTASSRKPLVRPGLRRRARTSGWWAISNTTSSSAIASSRVGPISIRWRSTGCGRKRTNAATAPSIRLSPSGLRPRRPPCSRSRPQRYDTSYWELRQVSWDAYIEVRGNRYSVPAALAGRRVSVRLSLDEVLSVFEGETCVARHALVPATAGWVTVPEHHAALWASTMEVEHRPLSVYEEVSTWS